MRKYSSDPKSFKHENSSDADFEKGGSFTKMTSKVNKIIKIGSKTALHST